MSSWCAAELERKPQDTFAARAEDITRENLVVQAVADLTHQADPFQYLPEVLREIIGTWQPIAPERRILRVEGTGKANNPTIAADQMLWLRSQLDNAGMTPAAIFVDSEEEWPEKFTRRDHWRTVCSPFDCPVVLWNHVAPGSIPCKYWAGDFMGRPIGNVSNLETYVGWYTPAGVNDPAKNEPAEMWQSWIRCMNAIRSALQTGPCIPHLPVVHTDPVLARWYTRQTIIHAILAGCTQFYWASYMSDAPKEMAAAISAALTEGDDRTSTWRKYKPAPIPTNARSVTTRGFTTWRP